MLGQTLNKIFGSRNDIQKRPKKHTQKPMYINLF